MYPEQKMARGHCFLFRIIGVVVTLLPSLIWFYVLVSKKFTRYAATMHLITGDHKKLTYSKVQSEGILATLLADLGAQKLLSEGTLALD